MIAKAMTATTPMFWAGFEKASTASRTAIRIGARAAKVGFDWNGPEPILDKVREELDELRTEHDLMQSQSDEISSM